MLRLAALGLYHEANTFSRHHVDRAAIASATLRDDEIVREHRAAQTTMAGYLSVASNDVDVVPLVMTTLTPAGVIDADALAEIVDELVAALSTHGPFDGVLAALHGAAVAEDHLDADGYLLERFRDTVGPDVPIGVGLDLHANVSARMCANATVLNTYLTNPHVDARERGARIADLVIRAARGEVRPTMAFQPVPAAINILCQNTGTPPMSDIMAQVAVVAARPGVLDATVAEGYPYADVPEMGMSAVVVTDADPDAAARYARELGASVWARREDFQTAAASPEEALRRAERAPRGPVLLLEVGDNIGGGSPGDSVDILREARRLGFARLLTIVADPQAAATCVAAGVGSTVTLSIGGKDPETAPPVEADATVLALHDGRYRSDGPTHSGRRSFDAGPTAAVRLDTGQTVVVTTQVVPPWTTAQITVLGLRPDMFAAIAAKGVHSPLAAYGPHVTEIIQVDTPGVTCADLSNFRYRHRRRPLYPFERDATYPIN